MMFIFLPHDDVLRTNGALGYQPRASPRRGRRPGSSTPSRCARSGREERSEAMSFEVWVKRALPALASKSKRPITGRCRSKKSFAPFWRETRSSVMNSDMASARKGKRAHVAVPGHNRNERFLTPRWGASRFGLGNPGRRPRRGLALGWYAAHRWCGSVGVATSSRLLSTADANANEWSMSLNGSARLRLACLRQEADRGLVAPQLD
jgi:hypothetical protein